MPSRNFVDTVANRYLVAFAAVWKDQEFVSSTPGEPSVMFCVATRSAEATPVDYSSLARQTSLDLVMLEFEPGAEGKGPWNVVVYRTDDAGVLLVIPEASLWLSPRKLVMALIPSSEDHCLLFNGASIASVAVVPEGDLGPGRSAARRRLREAYRRTPSIRDFPQRVFPREPDV